LVVPIRQHLWLRSAEQRSTRVRTTMRILKEPLLHFLLAGAALFGAYGLINRGADAPAAKSASPIHIRAGDVQ
jgi:hypothetical protein